MEIGKINYQTKYAASKDWVAAMGKDSDIIKFKQIPEAAEAVCMKVYGPYDRLNENIREVLGKYNLCQPVDFVLQVG